MDKSSCLESSDPNSSPPRSSPTIIPSPPSSPPDSNGWQKPSKVARRRPPGDGQRDSSREGSAVASAFGVLNPLCDVMDLSPVEMPNPHDSMMTDPSAVPEKSSKPSKI